MVVTHSKNVFQHKIAYISDQLWPNKIATSEQTINTVSALAAEGVDITLIIPKHWRNLGTSRKSHKEKLLNFYHVQNGFELTRLFYLPFAPMKIRKASQGFIGPLYASIFNYEIIYTRNLLPALVGWALGKKVVFETWHTFDRFRIKTAKRLAKLSNSPNFLGIISHSVSSKNSLIHHGVLEEKITVIPNGFNPEISTPPLAQVEARRILGWKEQDKIVCYAGRIDIEKGSQTILELAEKTPEINYLLIGYSENKPDDWILNVAAQKRLKNIRWSPWVTTKDLWKFLFASDVLIIPPTASPWRLYHKTGLPMKLFLYMAAGRPILAPLLPDIEDLLDKENAALVEPDNLYKAQQTIRRLFEDNAWADSIAKQAQLDSKSFTWQSRAKKVIAFINERFEANSI